MISNDKAELFVLHRGNISGPYTLVQVRSMRERETCDRFTKVSQDQQNWHNVDLFLSEVDLRAATPAPLVPPALPGILASQPRWSEPGLLRPFPVFALLLLHYLTAGIYTFFWVTAFHEKLPRLKSDDPSGAKAIALCFVPIYQFYWIFVVYLRLATRLNALCSHHHLPQALPMPLAWALCVLWLIPFIMFAMGAVALSVLMLSQESTAEVRFLFFLLPIPLLLLNLLLVAPVYAALAQAGLNRVADAQLALLLAQKKA